jgi:hypothetical protein
MVESEQHQLRGSLDLFLSKEKKKNGNKLAKEWEGKEIKNSTHEAWTHSCPGCTGAAPSSSCKEFQVLRILKTLKLAIPKSHCFYQLSREVLPKVMK